MERKNSINTYRYIKCLINHSFLVCLTAFSHNWADKMHKTSCCWGPLFVCPATLIHCCGCSFGTVLCQREPRPVVNRAVVEAWFQMTTLLSLQHRLWPFCSTKLADAEQVMWLTLLLHQSGCQHVAWLIQSKMAGETDDPIVSALERIQVEIIITALCPGQNFTDGCLIQQWTQTQWSKNSVLHS